MNYVAVPQEFPDCLRNDWKRCSTECCLTCPHFPRLVRESVHWPGNNMQFPFDVQIKFTFSVRVVDNGWLFHTCTSQFWLSLTYTQVLFLVVFSPKIFILLLSLGQNKSTLIFTSSIQLHESNLKLYRKENIRQIFMSGIWWFCSI